MGFEDMYVFCRARGDDNNFSDSAQLCSQKPVTDDEYSDDKIWVLRREISAPELAAFQIKPHPELFCNFPLPGSDDMTTTMVMIAMMMLMMTTVMTTAVTMAMMMLTMIVMVMVEYSLPGGIVAD